MSLHRAVAPFEGDGRELRLAELVVGAENQIDGIGMAEYTAFHDGMSEVEHSFGLTRSDIPNPCLGVVRCRRLEQKRWNGNEVTETDLTGADGVGDGILGGQSARGETVDHDAIGIMANFDPRIRRNAMETAVR
jgi:hypothetical protein